MPVSASPLCCFCSLRVRRRALNLLSDPFARPSISFSRRFFPIAKACWACAVCAFALVSTLTNPPCSAPGGTTVCTVWINWSSRQSIDGKVGLERQPGAVPPTSYAPISQGASPAPLPSSGRAVRDDHVAEGGSAEVVEAATAARGGAVVRDGDVGQCCDRGDVVVGDAPAETRHVSTHRDIFQRGRPKIVDAPAVGGGGVAAHDAVGQGNVIDIRDAAPAGRCGGTVGDDQVPQSELAANVENTSYR